MRRSWGLLLAALVIVSGLLAVPNGSASAATPGGTVTSTDDGVAVSWHTPATRTGDASVMNHVLAHTALSRSSPGAAAEPAPAAFAGASSVVTLRDSRAPRVYQFPLTLPAGAQARLQPDGSVTILDAHGAPLGSFQTPWATDAAGQRVSTHYSLSGSPRTGYVLAQHVDPNGGATYPITADPHYTWGIVSGTVYFNKSETAKIAATGAFLTGLASFAPPPFDAVFYAVAGVATVKAGYAVADGKCIKIKSYGEVAIYSGGYCE